MELSTILPNKLTKTIALLSFIMLLFGCYIGYQRLKSEYHTKNAFAARHYRNWPLVKKEIDIANGFFSQFDPTSMPLIWYKGMAYFNENNIEQALGCFKAAYENNPYHPYVLSNIGTCQEQLGRHEQALSSYQKALDVYPNFEDAIFNTSAIYYNLGKNEDAYNMLRRVNYKSLNIKYLPYSQLMVKPRFKTISDTISTLYIKTIVLSMYESENWWFDEFKKSVENKIPLEKQIAKDIVWVFENTKINPKLRPYQKLY